VSTHRHMSSSISVEKMYLALNDGRYLEWLRETNEYTVAREAQYVRWCELCRQYKALKFSMMLSTTATKNVRESQE